MIKLEILGTGCPKCRQMAENAEAAAKELGVEFELSKVTKLDDIMQYGVMMPPGLVLNGTLKASGKVLSVDEIKNLMTSV